MIKFKKVSAIILSAIMAVSVGTVSISAEEIQTPVKYISDTSSYSADKITHSENGVKAPDGIVNYLGNGVDTDNLSEGFYGDRAQSYSWSAVGYGDYMYIGTCANAMTSTLTLMKSALGDNFDQKTMEATLNAMYNGHFFVSEEDGGDPKGILIKLNVKTGEVKLLMSKETTGTGCLFRNAVKYNGMLYFCGSVNGIPSIYQIDPETDEYKLVYQSMTLEEYGQAFQQGICVGIRGMCVFRDKLIVSLINLDGAYICATDDPSNPNSFETVADMEDLFNYPAYNYSDSIYGGSIWDMIEYNNSLYVSICTGTPNNKPDENTMQSFALVRADVDENGNWKWTSVIGDKEKDNAKYTFGIDPERTRSGAANLMVYGDYLYIGEYNDEEIALEDILFSKNCNFVNANLEQSVNLYRMDKNEDVELVVGDADEMFPEGSLTGLGSGFGRNENQYIWRMEVYNNKLYVGTFDTSSLLEPIGQFTNGDLFKMTPDEWKSQINYLVELLKVLKDKSNSVKTVSAVSPMLSNAQREELKQIVNNEENSDIDSNTISKLDKLNEKLEELKQYISENINQEFVQKYQEIYNSLKEIAAKLPEDVYNLYQKLISNEILNNAKSFLICGAYMAKAERGFDLYVIDENLNVETITTNGFGDPYNHGCRVFAITNRGLSIGTANPFYGTQVWNLKENLKYDVDSDGIESVKDATIIQLYCAHFTTLTEEQYSVADIDKDGLINVKDATLVQLYLAKLL